MRELQLRTENQFVEIAVNTDATTLRRIALLVVRAAEDSGAGVVHERLVKISSVIDHMKRAVVLGRPFEPDDVARLQTLVTRLPEKPSNTPKASELVRSSVIRELRDLVSHVDGEVHRAAAAH